MFRVSVQLAILGCWPAVAGRGGSRPQRAGRGPISALSIPPAASRARPSRSGWADRAWTTSIGVLVTGTGVSAKVVEYDRRLGNQEITLLKEQLKELKRGTPGDASKTSSGPR